MEDSSSRKDRSRRKSSTGKHDPQLSFPHHCLSLFELTRSCNLLSITLETHHGIPGDEGISGNDAIHDDVIQLSETDVAGAAALSAAGGPWWLDAFDRGDAVVPSAFRPVGRATATRISRVKTSIDNTDDGRRLVVVSQVLRDVTVQGHSLQLLPGDIPVEV